MRYDVGTSPRPPRFRTDGIQTEMEGANPNRNHNRVPPPTPRLDTHSEIPRHDEFTENDTFKYPTNNVLIPTQHVESKCTTVRCWLELICFYLSWCGLTAFMIYLVIKLYNA